MVNGCELCKTARRVVKTGVLGCMVRWKRMQEHRYKGVKKIISVFLPLLYDAYTMMGQQEGANVGRHGGDICEMKGDSWRIVHDVPQSHRVMGGDPQRGRGMEPRRRDISKGVTHVPSLLSLLLLLWCAFLLIQSSCNHFPAVIFRAHVLLSCTQCFRVHVFLRY